MTQTVEFGGQCLGTRARFGILVGDHDVHVERRNRCRPAQPELVVLLLGDHCDQSRHPDAVGPHGQPHRLAVLAKYVDGECVGVFAAQLEDVADLDAAGTDQRPATVRRRIAVADFGRLDDAVRGEVAAGHQSDDVLALLVGAGDPRSPGCHPGVDEIANTVGQQGLWPDVSLPQEGVLGEVGVVEHGVFGRIQRCTQALVVDLAITGNADREQLPVTAGLTHLEHHILQGVRRGDRPAELSVGPLHECRDGRSVTGVVDHRRGQSVQRQRLRHRRCHRLDVGGVPRLHATHKRVFADLAFGQELL